MESSQKEVIAARSAARMNVPGKFKELSVLCVFLSGLTSEAGWKEKTAAGAGQRRFVQDGEGLA